MDVHRFLRGRQDILFPSRRDVSFQDIEEHVGMFDVGLAMRCEVGHLRGGEI